MHTDVVTLFNRYRSPLGDMWYPTILRGVYLSTDRANIVAKFGESSSDNAILHVPYVADSGVKVISGKAYKTPKAWERQTNDMLPVSVTFTTGNDFDFFWHGEWPDEKPISDEDYTDGFYDHINRLSDSVYAVTKCACYSVIPHFEIGGK